MMVSMTKNILKQGHVINELGRSGTGVALGPVLLFEPYLAIKCLAGGEPPTGFPPGTRKAEPAFAFHS